MDGASDHDRSSDLPPDIGSPARRALTEAGLVRLDQLRDITEADLRRLHGVGPTAVQRLRRALAARGHSFGDRSTATWATGPSLTSTGGARAVPYAPTTPGEEGATVAQEIPDGVVMEPIFVVEATYGPDAAEIRPKHRPTHLARIAALRAAGVVIEAGAFPDLSGSLLLVRTSDEDAALAIAREDVYMREGVWVEARARPFVRVARPDEVPA